MPEDFRRKNKPDKERQGPKGSKKVHGLLPEPTYKSDGEQIKETIDESFKSEFGIPVFTLTVLNYFFRNACKPSPLGDHRNIPVHFTIYRYVLYYG